MWEGAGEGREGNIYKGRERGEWKREEEWEREMEKKRERDSQTHRGIALKETSH